MNHLYWLAAESPSTTTDAGSATPSTDTPAAFWGVIGLGLVAILLVWGLQRSRIEKGGTFSATFARVFGLTIIATLGAALTFTTVSSDSRAAAFTLLGTIAGYLVGAKVGQPDDRSQAPPDPDSGSGGGGRGGGGRGGDGGGGSGGGGVGSGVAVGAAGGTGSARTPPSSATAARGEVEEGDEAGEEAVREDEPVDPKTTRRGTRSDFRFSDSNDESEELLA